MDKTKIVMILAILGLGTLLFLNTNSSNRYCKSDYNKSYKKSCCDSKQKPAKKSCCATQSKTESHSETGHSHNQ